ncbi:MAG: hypothetical protein GXO49_00495 [Chlorobi bacterium]|nr:hypothetical protein [Chlorobiota bacterium]
MHRKNLILNKKIKFKKWENSAWSIFNSIGKQIIISVLPIAYLMFSFLTLEAQTDTSFAKIDTVQLPDVQIISSRIPLLNSEIARSQFARFN